MAPEIVALPETSRLRGLIGRPALVIFLRSFGCTFCREALADVRLVRSRVEAAGATLAFVYGGTPAEADPWFALHGFGDTVRISDPALEHFRAFRVDRIGYSTLLHPTVVVRTAVCATTHGLGTQTAEMIRQLAAVFVVRDGRILASYRHRLPSDRPDYMQLIRTALGK
jgi:hypothetical protein